MEGKGRIGIYFIDLKQDDPKKATMKRLKRFNLAEKVPRSRIQRGLLLNPFADIYVTARDSKIITGGGLTVIEGSWNRADSLKKIMSGNARKLPPLVPVNPVNYGKVGLLSSVEAVAAALYLTGFKDLSELILGKFSWGINFITVNREPLCEYSSCYDQDCITEKIKLFY